MFKVHQRVGTLYDGTWWLRFLRTNNRNCYTGLTRVITCFSKVPLVLVSQIASDLTHVLLYFVIGLGSRIWHAALWSWRRQITTEHPNRPGRTKQKVVEKWIPLLRLRLSARICQPRLRLIRVPDVLIGFGEMITYQTLYLTFPDLFWIFYWFYIVSPARAVSK